MAEGEASFSAKADVGLGISLPLGVHRLRGTDRRSTRWSQDWSAHKGIGPSEWVDRIGGGTDSANSHRRSTTTTMGSSQKAKGETRLTQPSLVGMRCRLDLRYRKPESYRPRGEGGVPPDSRYRLARPQWG
jgi:hypothetical protein